MTLGELLCAEWQAVLGPDAFGNFVSWEDFSPEQQELWNTAAASFLLKLNVGELRAAARAVVDRWETPAWADAEPTAFSINRLRRALESEP